MLTCLYNAICVLFELLWNIVMNNVICVCIRIWNNLHPMALINELWGEPRNTLYGIARLCEIDVWISRISWSSSLRECCLAHREHKLTLQRKFASKLDFTNVAYTLLIVQRISCGSWTLQPIAHASSSNICLDQANLFCLLTSLTNWQYFGRVAFERAWRC